MLSRCNEFPWKRTKGKKREKISTFLWKNEEKKKRKKNSPTKFHDLPANLSGSEHAGRDGERSRCGEEKLNFQGVLFLCSGSVTLFKFAPLCCLFARNSVSIVQIYFALAFEGKRVLNGLVCKHRNTCSNAKICVFCQIQKHLVQCQKFVYFAKYKDTCCSSVKICVFCRCRKCKSMLWSPEQWSRGIFSDDNRTPKGCHLCAVSEEVSVNLLQFFLQECYKKQKLQIDPSSKQIGCSFWNISYVDVSLVVSKMCTFLKTSVDIILIFRPLVIMSSH